MHLRNSVKRPLQSDLFAYRSLGESFVSLVRAGPSQLFRGAAASAMRDAPYAGFFLVSYEHLKRESGETRFFPIDIWVLSRHAAAFLQPVSSSSTVLINAFAGAGAGTAATLVTHPFDVLKVGIQSAHVKR